MFEPGYYSTLTYFLESILQTLKIYLILYILSAIIQVFLN